MWENQFLIDAVEDFLQFIPLVWWEYSSYGLSWTESIDGKPIPFQARVVDEQRIPDLKSAGIRLRAWIPGAIGEVESFREGLRIQLSHSADWYHHAHPPEILKNLETMKRYRPLRATSSNHESRRELAPAYPFDFVQSVLLSMPIHRWERLLMDLVWDGEIDGNEFHVEAAVLEKTEEKILVNASLEFLDLSSEMSEGYMKFSSTESMFELILGEK